MNWNSFKLLNWFKQFKDTINEILGNSGGGGNESLIVDIPWPSLGIPGEWTEISTTLAERLQLAAAIKTTDGKIFPSRLGVVPPMELEQVFTPYYMKGVWGTVALSDILEGATLIMLGSEEGTHKYYIKYYDF